MCKARRADVRKKQSNADTIYYLRDYLGRSISNCDRVDVDENVGLSSRLSAFSLLCSESKNKTTTTTTKQKNIVIGTHQSEIVYAFQIPLPRDNRVLRLHRLFQTMTCVLQMQVHFESTTSTTDGGADGEQSSPLVYEETQVEHLIPMDVVLASRNSGDLDDKWQMMAHGKPNKTFKCIKVNMCFLFFVVVVSSIVLLNDRSLLFQEPLFARLRSGAAVRVAQRTPRILRDQRSPR